LASSVDADTFRNKPNTRLNFKMVA
jgi:hypothetical protein